jgi:hypothetical protein
VIAIVVDLLCAATATLCAVLLGRAWVRSRVPLLAWSTICFTALAIDNVLMFWDVLVPDTVLFPWRRLFSLAGAVVMVIGLAGERR